ncbi:MAG: SGNH/GDSL hydrolase family protein [Flavobacteriaceae bacterium]|nr:SGNH/GDSL hydrolase family protein [Flavobacteriaceae bacterium]
MRSIVKIIGINLLVLLGLLFSAEIGLRVIGKTAYTDKLKADIVVKPNGKYFEKDTLLGYKQIAGKFDVTLKKEFHFSTTHNKEGNRVTSYHPEKYEGKPEIWMLGCSFTHGWSINDDETLAWQLQSNFEDYKVENFGVEGYGTLQFLLKFERALKQGRKPEILIVNHIDFHFERNIFTARRRLEVSTWNRLGELNQPYVELTDKGDLLIKHSKVDYTPWMLSKYSALFFSIQKKYEWYLDKQMRLKQPQITEMILDKIVALCRENNIKLLLTNIYGDKNFIESYSLKNNIPFVDISVNTDLKEYSNRPYDPHPNAKANKIYWKKLEAYLKNDFFRNE